MNISDPNLFEFKINALTQHDRPIHNTEKIVT